MEFRTNDNPLFPSLTGGSPGDNPDLGQSLDETPVLPPLTPPPPENFPEAKDVSVAQAEAAFSQQGGAEDSNVVTAPSGGVPPEGYSASSRKRSAEARIAQLTARYRTTQDQNSVLANELHRLRETIATMQAGGVQPAGQRHPGNAPPQAPDLPISADPTGSASTNRGVDLGAVEAAIARHIKPLTDRITQTDEALQRKTEHEQSWSAAVADFPELQQPGDANALFNELYRTHPLRLLPDGPEQIAVMVKGILADSRREQAAAAHRKIGAAVHIPSVSPTDVLPRAQEERIGEAIRQSADKLRRGDNSFDTYRALRLATAARQRQLQRG